MHIFTILANGVIQKLKNDENYLDFTVLAQ